MRYLFLALVIFFLLLFFLYSYKITTRLYISIKGKQGSRIIILLLTILWYLPLFLLKAIWSIYLLYVIISFLFVDIILIMLKLFKKNINSKVILFCPFIFAIIISFYGYYNAHSVIKTSYNVTTNKNLVNNYKIGLISDVHYGSSLTLEEILKYVNEINNENLDFLVLAGDIVDEQTNKEEYKLIFETLGKINTKYGIYYVHGNHDENRYLNATDNRNKLLLDAIKKANIIMLNEETIEINNELLLTGRIDYSYKNTGIRKNSNELTEPLDKNKYLIVADHQPKPYKENKDARYDLQLSGHTHAGQIWPFGLVTRAISFDYGKLEEDNFKLIVSSGFGVWGLPARTEKHSEYVIINLKNN